jgi:hypothetical protein
VNSNYVQPIFAVAAIFSLMQWENFAWEFQGQFWLASLIPLVAFFLWATPVSTNFFKIRRISGVSLGVLSLGTMANGILVLPIIAVASIFLRRSFFEIATLWLLAVASVGFYLSGYTQPGQHGSLETLRTMPMESLAHFFIYLGSPLARLVSASPLLVGVSFVLGAVLFSLSITVILRTLLRGAHKINGAGSVLMIIFILGSALITSAGRVIFGLEQATASRYATPALILTVILFALATRGCFGFLNPKASLTLVLVTSLLFLTYQSSEIQKQMKENNSRLIAGIGATLQGNDLPRLSWLYPDPNVVQITSQSLSRTDKTIFSKITDLAKKPKKQLTTSDCVGYIDSITPVEGSDYALISGWVTREKLTAQRYSLGKIFGTEFPQGIVVASGDYRPDVANIYGFHNIYSGWQGYLNADNLEVGPIEACTIGEQ